MVRTIHYFVWVALVFCLLSASVANAETNQNNLQEAELARSKESQAYYDQIQSVLSQKAFGEKKIVKKWRLKDQVEEKDEEENAFIKWLIELLKKSDDYNHDNHSQVNIAKSIEVLLWGMVIGLIVFLLVKYRKQLQAIVSGFTENADTEMPSTMFGLDVKKTSMPEDVISSAQECWRAGEQRQAIALLLRASLIKLLHEHDCSFLDSDTEAECCARIEQQVPKTLSQYMHLLVQVWQQIAYGHQAPPETVFNTLCRQWPEVF